MKTYHKIQSIFKRDKNNHKFIIGEYSRPEFEYLKDNNWIFTEKIDGTNIRIHWNMEKIRIGGRTDNAQIPAVLLDRINEILPVEKFKSLYPDIEMTLYGEGYGAKIQKGGGNYIPDGVDFILFDVMVNDIYLIRDGVNDIAEKLDIKSVPVLGKGTIQNMIDWTKDLISTFGDFLAEGIVARPECELLKRDGERIITKIKHKDL